MGNQIGTQHALNMPSTGLTLRAMDMYVSPFSQPLIYFHIILHMSLIHKIVFTYMG